ncbi:MAG: serine dehydratase subunit alpha family protein [Dehalococcoidia bacterium]|nr:serine dehydratase subunit alpha family protein [Dehalococcoidia bacterium]
MDELIAVLKSEIVPATGCTEPVAVALACRTAYEKVGGELTRVVVEADRGVYKNGLECIIPGSCMQGLEAAAALGIVGGNASLGLEVLGDVAHADEERTAALVAAGMVTVSLNRAFEGIHVSAVVETDRGSARCLIERRHDNVVEIEINGVVEPHFQEENGLGRVQWPEDRCFADIVGFVRQVPYEDVGFLLDGVQLNERLAEAGLSSDWGAGVGKTLASLVEKGILADDMVRVAERMTAAAVDARMGGAQLPALSVAGSGSHGIIATLPLVAVAHERNISRDELARALALSCLVTIYVKRQTGRLSAMCGCAVAGGSGASAGVAYLLGGNDEAIAQAVENVAASITGMICDGGNLSCASKSATGAMVGVTAALLAREGIGIPSRTGVVGDSVEETIHNMGLVSNPGMTATNDVVLDVMQKRTGGA